MVRNYLLPMFEKEGRKIQKKDSPRKDKKDDEPTTVYGELKLSEKLSLEMI